MKQPWIHSKLLDSIWIIGPPYFVLACVFLFFDAIVQLSESYNFFTWLILIVFIDVAHVYSSLFKTYFVRAEFEKHRTRYILVPMLSFVLGILIYSNGSLLFWSILAGIAIFHFIRQQYGIMRIYDRFEQRKFHKIIDVLAIYAATIYPITYWIYTPRQFNWFLENEFDWLSFIPNLLPFFTALYLIILATWLFKTIASAIQKKSFNLPKTFFILGTFMSWYFGIIYFNNDLIFTLLNVISHGVPYLALIYFNAIAQRTNTTSFISLFKTRIGVLLFIALLCTFAFSEEFVWEIFIWKEHFDFNINTPKFWQNILVPLLATPQLSHYILDGFIWKREKPMG